MTDTPTDVPESSHTDHDNPFVAAAAQARAHGLEQIARAFDALSADDDQPAPTESTVHNY